MKSDKFYDEVSKFYGKMIDFEKNLDIREKAYKSIFTTKEKIADIGCGIGLDSIALSKNGHRVTSFDISPQMIKSAKLLAKNYNVKIDALTYSFDTVPERFNNKFDAVISVGNTIAHLNKKELLNAILHIKRISKPGAKIFLHILNYKVIIAQNKRINNIAVRDGLTIIRFYDFLKTKIGFNILTFQTASPKQFELVTTDNYPHTSNQIKGLLKIAGFKSIRTYSSFSLNEYDESASKDLFICAENSLE